MAKKPRKKIAKISGNNRFQNQTERGEVFPIRRPLSWKDQERFHSIGSALLDTDRLRGIVNGVYRADDIATTQFSWKQLRRAEKSSYPSTIDILNQVPTRTMAISAELGGFAVYGSDRFPLLGIQINSLALLEERLRIQELYAKAGVHFHKMDRVAENPNIHLTVARIDAEMGHYVRSPDFLDKLDAEIGQAGTAALFYEPLTPQSITTQKQYLIQ